MKPRPRFSIFAQVFFAILAAAAVFGAIFGGFALRNQAAATDRAQQEFQKSMMRADAAIRMSKRIYGTPSPSATLTPTPTAAFVPLQYR